MKVLLTAASQHGATTEVAEAIARRLKADGLEVVCKPPQDVDSLEGFDAVICGSAVYMTQWMPAAHDFMERFAQELHKVPVWAFSVGMNGVPKHVPQDPSRIGPVLTRIDAKELRSFAGRYDPSLLSLRERAIVRLAGAVEGDFRDWDAIDDWAHGIAQELTRQ
mgnify:FL=1